MVAKYIVCGSSYKLWNILFENIKGKLMQIWKSPYAF